MGIEHVLLIVTAIAGVLKAYFEMRKAKAESLRAGEAESMLKATVEGIEEAKADNPEEGKKIVEKIQKQTKFYGLDSKFHAIVKEITEGEGDVRKVTSKFSKTKLRRVLTEEELDGEDKYL